MIDLVLRSRKGTFLESERSLSLSNRILTMSLMTLSLFFLLCSKNVRSILRSNGRLL